MDYQTWYSPIVLTGTCDGVNSDGHCSTINVWYVYKGRDKLPENVMVNITIYDMMGRVINNLVASKESSGFKSAQWKAVDNFGQPVSAGVYLYRIETGSFSQTKKMILLK